MGIMLSPENLRCHPVFAGLDHAMLKALAMAGEQVRVSQGEWLFYEGDQADALYVILDGKVEIKAALDRERTYHVGLCILVKGDLLGWSAVVEPHIYRLSAVAVQESILAKWNGPDLLELMAHHPAEGFTLMKRILEIMGGRFTEICSRFASLVEGKQWQSITAPRSPKVNSDN